MKKYEWLREDALKQVITEEDCLRLRGNSVAWRRSGVYLARCVLEKIITEDDAVSLRNFRDSWLHTRDYVLLPNCVFEGSYLCERVIIDSGYENPEDYNVSYKAKKFIESRRSRLWRNLARLAAMLTMRGMRKNPRFRDVAPMVARLIWASRGVYTQKCADAYYLDLIK